MLKVLDAVFAMPFRSLLLVLALGACTKRGEALLGDLPPGAVATRQIRNVEIELSLRFWMDPATLRGRVPPDTPFATVETYQVADSIIPNEYGTWIDASLVVTSADIRVNGQKVAGHVAGGEAFWWLQLDSGELGDDVRTRGEHQAVELAYWLPDSGAVAGLGAAGVPARVGEAWVRSDGDGWTFSFDLEGSLVRGHCTLSGDVTREDYTVPAYSTVWSAGLVAPGFTVFTYAGHRSQRCRVDEIEVVGDGPLAQSLRASLEIQPVFGVAMTGWYADAGYYVRTRDGV